MENRSMCKAPHADCQTDGSGVMPSSEANVCGHFIILTSVWCHYQSESEQSVYRVSPFDRIRVSPHEASIEDSL